MMEADEIRMLEDEIDLIFDAQERLKALKAAEADA